jgi:hypothetical protein
MVIGGGAIRRVGDEPDVRKTLSGCVRAPTALNFSASVHLNGCALEIPAPISNRIKLSGDF